MTTRWLSEDEQRTWRAYLSGSRVLLDRLDAQLQRDAGMPHGYYEILVHLSEQADRRMRMSQLADETRSSRSRLSHAVSALEAKGWVRREKAPDDARGQVAVLTDEGFAVLEAAAPGHVEQVRQALFDPLTPGQVVALREVFEALQADVP